MWTKFTEFSSSHNLSWDTFCVDVVNKRDEWDHLGTIRLAKGRVVDDDKVEEFIVLDCPEKKMYADFWAFYFKIPKTDIRAGFVGHEWASKLAIAEPALFSDFLEIRGDALIPEMRGDQQDDKILTFASWIQQDVKRANAKLVYDQFTDCAWSSAYNFANVVKPKLGNTLSFHEFVDQEYLVLAYVKSFASDNVGLLYGGVSLETFSTRPVEYLKFYEGAFRSYSFEKFLKDCAENWEFTDRKETPKKQVHNLAYLFEKVIEAEIALQNAENAPTPDDKVIAKARSKLIVAQSVSASEIKAILDAYASRCSITASELVDVNVMIKKILVNESMLYGSCIMFQHTGITYTVTASIFDGILLSLVQALQQAKPDLNLVERLFKLLPVDNEQASQIISSAVFNLRALHADEVKATETALASTTASKLVRQLEAELVRLQARKIDEICTQISNSAYQICTDAEGQMTPLLKKVHKLLGERIQIADVVSPKARAVKTRVVKTRVVKASKTTKVSKDTTSLLKCQGVVPEQEDEDLLSTRQPTLNALQMAGRFQSAQHSYYFKKVRHDIDTAKEAFVLGPFARKQDAKSVSTFLRRKYGAPAVIDAMYQNDDSPMIHEVHLVMVSKMGSDGNRKSKGYTALNHLTTDDSHNVDDSQNVTNVPVSVMRTKCTTNQTYATLCYNHDFLVELASLLPVHGADELGIPLSALNAPAFKNLLAETIEAQASARLEQEDDDESDASSESSAEDDESDASSESSAEDEDDDDESDASSESSAEDDDDDEDDVVFGKTVCLRRDMVPVSAPTILYASDFMGESMPIGKAPKRQSKTVRANTDNRNTDRNRQQHRRAGKSAVKCE